MLESNHNPGQTLDYRAPGGFRNFKLSHFLFLKGTVCQETLLEVLTPQSPVNPTGFTSPSTMESE